MGYEKKPGSQPFAFGSHLPRGGSFQVRKDEGWGLRESRKNRLKHVNAA